MSPRNPRILLRYSLAVALCLLAVVLRWALSPYLGDTGPFITMFPMVVFATLLFGIGPGITATLLSAVLANVFMYQSGYDGGTPITEAVAKTTVFLVLGGMINWMASNRCPVKILLGDPSVFAEQRAAISERELKATEERLKMAEAVSGYGTWEWDLVTGEIRYSDGIYELTGTEPGPESPESLWKRSLGEDSVKALTSAFERAFEEKRAEFQLDTQITRKDGSLRWITIRAKVIYDESGKAVRAIGLNFDVNKRKESEIQISKLNRELAQRVGELQAIFDIAPVGIAFSEDPKCNVVKANRALATMIGVRPDDNISTNSSNASSVRFKYLKDGRELTHWELPMQRAIAEKRPIVDDEIDVLRADGRAVSMLASACPIFDADGNVIGCVSAQVDVTETKRLMSELQDQVEQANTLRRQAEDASKIKDQFLAAVSHELRTPLSSISGWTAVLKQEGTPDETVKRGLRAIENATKAQGRLISDLLEISRMTSDGFRMENGAVELVPLLASAVETMRPLAAQKNLSIEIDADPSVSGVFGDECRIEQVVLNLLHNAIKFSFDGGSIQVTLHGDDTDAVISVKDKGRGIGKDFLPFVFEKFRQEDDSIAKSFSGLGLGLAIAKRLVELHGGTIAAESKGEGEGATFTVRLPVKRTVFTDVTSTEVPEMGGFSNGGNPDSDRLKGTTVLIVDDEEDSREVIKIFLEQCGATVVLAGSSEDALREFRSAQPDVIVSDIGMPDEDGYSLIRKIRASEGPGAEVPAIAVTAFARYEDRSRALTAGFDDHLSKPIEPSELIELIAGFIRTKP